MKKFLTVAFAFMALLLVVTPALATCTLDDPSGCTPNPPIRTTAELFNFLSKVTSWMFVTLLFLAFIFIVVGAFTYVSSKGDPKAVTLAKNYIIYALIGVVVGVLAKGLILAVCSIMGVACTLLF